MVAARFLMLPRTLGTGNKSGQSPTNLSFIIIALSTRKPSKKTDGLNASRAAIHEVVKPAREAGGRGYYNLRIVCTDMANTLCDFRIQAIFLD